MTKFCNIFCTQIDKLLDHLATFEMAFSRKESGMWSKFRKQSLPEIVALLLHHGRLRPATVLCTRHEVVKNIFTTTTIFASKKPYLQ